MKFIVAFLLTALLAFTLGLFMPWWSIAIAAFAVAALIPQKAFKSFIAGFLGLFFLWGGLSWWIDMKNEGILSKRIGGLLQIGDNTFLLILATAVIGGIVAGCAAISGTYLRQSPVSGKE